MTDALLPPALRSRLVAERDRAISRAATGSASSGRDPFQDAVYLLANLRDATDAQHALDALGGSRVKVRSEPMTYERGGPHSYFRDLILTNRSGGLAPGRERDEAKGRLARHEREVSVELEKRRRSDAERFADAIEGRGGTWEARTDPNRTPGQGGNFAPPLWLIDRAAAAPLAGRPLAGLVGSLPLPAGCQSVNVPRLTVNPTAAIQTADAAANSATDLTDAGTAANVNTISGQIDMSLQMLEQAPPPGLDVVLGNVLVESYDAQLEGQVLNGTGASGQHLGVMKVTGITAVTYTDSSPTPAECYPTILQAAAQLADARARPPEVVLMGGRRWWWLCTPTSTDGLLTNPPGRGYLAANLVGDGEPIGPLAGLPTFLDESVPRTLGAGTQDAIVLTRPSDHLLFESEPIVRVLVEVLSGTLQARLELHRYSAFFGGLVPSATAVVSGTGLAAVSGY